MGKVIVLSFLVFATSFVAKAQFKVSGKITTIKREPLEAVSVTVKNTYNGTTSLADGTYSFLISDSGRFVIEFTMNGYHPFEKEISITQQETILDVYLKEAITELKAVVITAGTFEAGDKKRATVLKSVDMVTTAGQQADIVSALKTLPGAQQVGEQEGLFVRGGTGNETKVFIDGMMVTNPFFSSVPGIAQRSRFSPLLFKGTSFSSGGYSAQYGQGLSSVLVLESIDLPSRSEVNFILSSPQVSFMGQQLNKSKKSSQGLNINYMNLAPYFDVIPQRYEYTKAPEAFNIEYNFRKKTKNGMLKFYSYASTNKTAFNRPGLDEANTNESFSIRNYNLLSNLTFTSKLPKNWHMYAGSSFSRNNDNIKMNTYNVDSSYLLFEPKISNNTLQAKAVFTKSFPGLNKLYVGAETQIVNDAIEATDSIEFREIDDRYLAAFTESDIYFSSKLLMRSGLRYEYSSLLNRANISPRLSIAYKLNDRSQLSFAYGTYFQKPETNYLLRKSDLDFTKAVHYIFNYQKVHDGKTLRIESFYKKYTDLVTVKKNDAFAIENKGNGYAKGIELFWRDKTTLKNLDYWISYSFLDTKRKYIGYPSKTQPSFAAKHTVNVVAKLWVNRLSTQFSTTYSYASGRPYHNPNRGPEEFMSDRTIDYHSLGLQANYLKTFGNVNAVFIVNISNILGNEQIFGYRYASKVNSDNIYLRDKMTPMAKRFIFIGAYLSIGSDRRKTILD